MTLGEDFPSVRILLQTNGERMFNVPITVVSVKGR